MQVEPRLQGFCGPEGNAELHRGAPNLIQRILDKISRSQVYKMAKKADGTLGDFSVAITFPKVRQTNLLQM